MDECGSNPCQNGGECTDHVASYSCSCVPGFYGVSCGTEVDACASAPCAHDVACAPIDSGSFSCHCPRGFYGQLCEDDENECASAPCSAGSECVDGVDAYTCSCVPGYEGEHCEVEIDECSSSACQNGGDCVDQMNDYVCYCLPGFYGANCRAQEDACASNPCQDDITCSQTDSGSFSCNCTAGWEGETCQVNADEYVLEPFHCRVSIKCPLNVHTPAKGSVKVSLQTRDRVAIVAVQDSGIGIPLSEQTQIFER